MRVLHLFAGAGGGLLADLILGHTPVAAVEWDAYCCQVLRERAADGWFPDLHVHEGDIRLFDPSEYTGRVDCIAAGFPCTDLSVAGHQAGISEGTRSGLWSEVVRVAGIVRPRFLFLENVAAIVAIRPGLDVVLRDIASMGLDAVWCSVRASDIGADIERDRWFCLAWPSGVVGEARPGREHERAQPLQRCSLQTDDLDRPRDWLAMARVHVRSDDAVADRFHRTLALGNGQVPAQAALAWRILTCNVPPSPASQTGALPTCQAIPARSDVPKTRCANNGASMSAD